MARVLIILVMLLISAEVAMRYFLAHPIRGAAEISGYVLVYVTFLGAAWVLRRGQHVRIDLVLTKLKPRIQSIISIITSMLGAIACLIITWYGLKVVWEQFQSGTLMISVLEPPSFLIMSVIPVGSFLVFIQFLKNVYGYLVIWRASPNEEQNLT